MWKKFEQVVQFRQHRPPIDQTFKPLGLSVSNHSMQVQQAKSGDIPALLLLEKRVYNGRVPWSRATLQSELRQKSSLYLVVYEAATLVALAGIRWGSAEAHITNLAVDPDWQGQGLGSCLLERLIQLAQQWSCQRVSLEVRADNAIARRLYEEFGFTVKFVRPNYYQDVQQDGLKMVLRLD